MMKFPNAKKDDQIQNEIFATQMKLQSLEKRNTSALKKTFVLPSKFKKYKAIYSTLKQKNYRKITTKKFYIYKMFVEAGFSKYQCLFIRNYKEFIPMLQYIIKEKMNCYSSY